MSVIDDELEPTSLGTQVAGHLLRLPLVEASPVIRLHQVSYAFKAHRETGRAVAANRLVGIAGFAPTTFHALGARVAARYALPDVTLLAQCIRDSLEELVETASDSRRRAPRGRGHAAARRGRSDT